MRSADWLSPRSDQAGSDPSSRCALDPDIAALDLEPISFLMAREQPWTLEKLDATEFEYRCFLQLVRDHPQDSIVPSRDCDLYWHAHILTLELYLEHCQAIFGYPLLHYPFSGALGPEDEALQQARFRHSRRLFEELMNRVRRTHYCDSKGEEHEYANREIPDPGRYLGAVQGG